MKYDYTNTSFYYHHQYLEPHHVGASLYSSEVSDTIF